MRIFSAKRRWSPNTCMARVVVSCQEICCQTAMSVATRAKSRDEAMRTRMMSTSYPPSSNNCRKHRIPRSPNSSSSSNNSRSNSNSNSNRGGRGRCREALRPRTRTRRPPIKTFASVQTQSCAATAAHATFGPTARREKPCTHRIRHRSQFSWSCPRVIRPISGSLPTLAATVEVPVPRQPPSSGWMIGSSAKETTRGRAEATSRESIRRDPRACWNKPIDGRRWREPTGMVRPTELNYYKQIEANFFKLTDIVSYFLKKSTSFYFNKRNNLCYIYISIFYK